VQNRAVLGERAMVLFADSWLPRGADAIRLRSRPSKMRHSRSWAQRLLLAGQALACAAGSQQPLESKSGGVQEPPGLTHHLVGHQGHIYGMAFGDEALLATGARDNTVAIWNLTGPTGRAGHRKPLRILEGHSRGVTAIAYASNRSRPGSEVFISGSADNTTRIWDARTGRVRGTARHPKTVFGVAAAPAPTRAEFGQAARDAPRDEQEEKEEEENGGEFATACWDGLVRIFNWPSGVQKAELSGHEGGLYGVSYNPRDGSLLATASADRTVRVWDLREMKLLWTLRSHRDHVTTVDWSPIDPYTLASGGWDRKFRLFEVNDREVHACRSKGKCANNIPPRSVGKHPQLVWKVAFSPNGEQVAACHGAVGQSPTVVVYDASTGRVVRRLGRHKDTPLVVAWSPDGSMLASAGMDRHVLVYDGHSEENDLPQGDVDDSEEQAKWRQDLEEFRTGRPNATRPNATGSANHSGEDAGNATQDANQMPYVPHPLQGRLAYL